MFHAQVFKVQFKENDIITPRLALIPITAESLHAERSADGLLGAITNANVPLKWPPEHWEPHVFELLSKRIADDPTEVAWHRYIALRHMDKRRTLIGTLGGFRKAERPDECEVGTQCSRIIRARGSLPKGRRP
jgi:[ribosomal protein S5]-alanine N-acetyltransferase